MGDGALGSEILPGLSSLKDELPSVQLGWCRGRLVPASGKILIGQKIQRLISGRAEIPLSQGQWYLTIGPKFCSRHPLRSFECSDNTNVLSVGEGKGES
jgi:hypothetical protein